MNVPDELEGPLDEGRICCVCCGVFSKNNMPGNEGVEVFSVDDGDMEVMALWSVDRAVVGFDPTHQMYNFPTVEADRPDLFGNRWSMLNPGSTAIARAVVVARKTLNQQKIR